MPSPAERQYLRDIKRNRWIQTPDYLRALRLREGLTLAALGKLIGRKHGLVCDLEKGRRLLTTDLAERYAWALDEPDARELVGRVINDRLERDGVSFRVSRAGLKPI